MDLYRKFTAFYSWSNKAFVNYYSVLDVGMAWENSEFGDLSRDECVVQFLFVLCIYVSLTLTVVFLLRIRSLCKFTSSLNVNYSGLLQAFEITGTNRSFGKNGEEFAISKLNGLYNQVSSQMILLLQLKGQISLACMTRGFIMLNSSKLISDLSHGSTQQVLNLLREGTTILFSHGCYALLNI